MHDMVYVDDPIILTITILTDNHEWKTLVIVKWAHMDLHLEKCAITRKFQQGQTQTSLMKSSYLRMKNNSQRKTISKLSTK